MRGSPYPHYSYPTPTQSYPTTYAPYLMTQPSLLALPQQSQPMTPLPLPPSFQPPQIPSQLVLNTNKKAIHLIHSIGPLPSHIYQAMPVEVNDFNLDLEGK